MQGSLDGIIVLDKSRVAGDHWAGKQLANYAANVIAVDSMPHPYA